MDVTGRKVVVVGEESRADSRAELARSAGAKVIRVPGKPAADDLRGAAAIFVVTGDEASDATAARAARVAGVPVNVADRPALCDFILPAIVDRDGVVVAISTGGSSPTLATVLRGRIEAALPERLGAVVRLAAAFRAQVKTLIHDPARRRAFFRGLVEGPAGRLAMAGDEVGARRVALDDLDAARRHLAPEGIAHIVGAGPGDPDLLTLRAAQLLQEADAILHDDLVPAPVLARARRDAELVAVGKRKGRAGWTQAEIDAELVRRVRAGETVVRLKAGDPFVFGRGGEEIDALRAAGLAYTIVPGITAALGCAAAAGIPLTHRRIASSITFLSGHGAEGAPGGEYDRDLHGRHGSRFRARPSSGRRHGSHHAGRHRRERHAARSANLHGQARRSGAARRCALPRWRCRSQPHHRGRRRGLCRGRDPTARKGVLMAKNLSGDLQVASANRLVDGIVVWLDDAGQWTDRLERAAVAREARASEILLERARAEGFGVIEPYLVAVSEDEEGNLEPLSLRERIRASGLTFDAIAADAVRYA